MRGERLVVVADAISARPDTNPFPRLWADGLRASGAEVLAWDDPSVPALVDLVHLHWPDGLFGRVGKSPGRLLRALRNLLRLVRLRRDGAMVVWTVHNVAPHDLKRADPLGRMLTRVFTYLVDEYWVLSDSTRQDLRRRRLPVRPVRTFRHPVYPTTQPTRPAEPGRRFVTFGEVRPYRGYVELVEAFGRRAPGTAEALTIVGADRGDAYSRELRAAVAATPAVEWVDRRVSDEELERFVLGANAVVLNYRTVTNSGAALLALSLGRPVVLPATPAFEELQTEVGPEWVVLNRGDLRTAFDEVTAAKTTTPSLGLRTWDAYAAAVHDAVRQTAPRLGRGRRGSGAARAGARAGAREHDWRLLVERTASVAIVRLVTLGARRDGDGHLLITGPGGGSVGDQAMFEAFATYASGPVIAVAQSESAVVSVPEPLRDRVSVVPLPGLLRGHTREYVRDLVRFARYLRSCRDVSVIGADVMDGVYSARSSVRRFWVPAFAELAGFHGRVLGFSWNAAPDPQAAAAMRWSSRHATLLARDPVSLGRLRADGARRAELVADLAFLAEPSVPAPEDVTAWIGQERAAGRTVVALNANSVLNARFDQVGEYVDLIRGHLDDGVSFVLVPHDSRNSPSDADLLADVANQVGPTDHVRQLGLVLEPGAMVSLLSQVDLAVSGRMHLTILAAVGGTPTVTVAYQGKVEGLYAALGLDSYIELDADVHEALWRTFRAARDRLPELRATLARTVPLARERAMRNVAGLTAGR